MAERRATPRLLVKIVGSKQVKQLMEEPPADAEAEPPRTETQLGRRTPGGAGAMEAQRRAGSGLWAAINQVPDRRCVTAPPADRSRSFIHLQTGAAAPRAAADAPEAPQHVPQRGASGGGASGGGASGGGAWAELTAAVREQLSDWPPSSLASVGVEAAALGGAGGGTLERSELALLFLRDGVPLKLPTLALLLHTFSHQEEPGQIRYRNLLEFIRAAAFPEECHADGELIEDDADRRADDTQRENRSSTRPSANGTRNKSAC